VDIKVAALSGKPLSAPLPRIVLRNLGGDGGDSPGDIANQIIGPMAGQTALAVSRTGIGESLGRGVEKLGETGRESATTLEGGLKKMLGK
jgi:hypothetical protein